MEPNSEPGTGAFLVVLAGALLWGIYWVPIRILEGLGLPGIWSGFVLTSAAFVVALMVRAACRCDSLKGLQIVAAMLVGIAFGFYGASISYTDVVRAILLFYLTPIWSMLLECTFLGRRWTWQSTVAIASALAGIVFIFRGELPVEGFGALGDWMAICAGLAWSIASMLVFAHGRVSIASLSTWSIGAGAVVSGICVLGLGATATSVWDAPDFDATRTLAIAFAFGAVYVVPVMFMTLWGTSQFSAATMGFLLTGEIVSGVATSALFLGEPFGMPEVVGTILIVMGATIEILGPRSAKPA